MARILAIGVATLDIVNIVPSYPSEDSEIRATAQRRCRGGNAANTLVILSQLGHEARLLCTFADDPDHQIIAADLATYHIDTSLCRTIADSRTPTSYILNSADTGSRSIVHYRELPELSAEDFFRADLNHIDWLHVEGRQITETQRMLDHIHRQAPQIPISIEIEKPRPDIDRLLPMARTLLFGRGFAQSSGFDSAEAFLRSMHRRLPEQTLFCGWGRSGAYAIDPSGQLYHAPAHIPPRIIDTLGAGDTFNAGVINGLLRGDPLAAVLTASCRLAGTKCGREGLRIGP